MKRLFLVTSILCGPAVAFAQGTLRSGPLTIANNLSEIATGDSGAQSTALPGGATFGGPAQSDSVSSRVTKLAGSVTVRAKGARCDGVTDDSSAIESAIRFAQTNFLAVRFPAANCVWSRPISGNGGPISLIFEHTTITFGGNGLSFSNTTTGNTHGSTAIDGLASTAGVVPGAPVTASGFPAGTIVAQVTSSTSVTTNLPSSTSLRSTLISFGLPALTLAQSANNYPIVAIGNVTFQSTASRSIPAAIYVSFPSQGGWERPMFDWYGKVNCLSSANSVPSPYAGGINGCLILNGVNQSTIYGLQYQAPLSSDIPTKVVPGTYGIQYISVPSSSSTEGPGVYNLVAFQADAAIWITGKGEGFYFVNPQIVSGNYGIKVGSATVNANGSYVGASGILGSGLNVNLLQVIGGEVNVARDGLFCDYCQHVITSGTHFYQQASDNTSPGRSVVLVDSFHSEIDGLFGGNAQHRVSGESGVLVLNNINISSWNRIRGTVLNTDTGVALKSGVILNDVDILVGSSVATAVSDSGSQNVKKVTGDGVLTISPAVTLKGFLQVATNSAGSAPSMAKASWTCGTNYSNGTGEVDCWNLQNNAQEFRWYGFSEGSPNLVASLAPSGFSVPGAFSASPTSFTLSPTAYANCTSLNTSSNVIGCVSSDERIKNDEGVISPDDALRLILSTPSPHRFRFKNGYGPAGEMQGFFAQDIEKVQPALVSTGPLTELTPDGEKRFDQIMKVPELVQAIKAQQRRIEIMRYWLTALTIGLLVTAGYACTGNRR